MSVNLRQAKTSGGRSRGITVLLVLVTLLTSATTFLGAQEIMPRSLPGPVSTVLSVAWQEWLRNVVAFAAAVFLQGWVIITWRLAAPAFSRRQPRLFLTWTGCGLIPSLASALLSSTVHMNVVAKFTLTEMAVNEARSAVLAPIQDFSTQAQKTSTQMTEFSLLAQSRSDLEGRTGKSCEGQSLAAECGPICRLRAAQAGQAKRMAGLASEIDREGAALTIDAAALDQEKVNRIFLAARELARDPRFAEIKTWIANQQKGFSSGFEWEGALRECSDPVAAAKLAELRRTLRVEPELPETPPILRDQTVGDSGSRNLHALAEVGGLLVRLRPAEAIAHLSEPDVSPFVPFWISSTLLELLCAVLSLIHGLGHLPDRGLPPYLRSRSDRGELGPEAQKRLRLALRVHRSFKVNLGVGATYFLTPVDGNAAIRNDAEFYAYAFRLSECDVPPMDVDVILKDHAPWLKTVSGGASNFRIWRYRRFSRRFRASDIEGHLIRALGASSATDSEPGPPAAPRLQVIDGGPSVGGAMTYRS